MSNGNEGIQPLLRLMRGKLADHRSKTNAEIDAMSQALDDYERREVKEIKVAPQETSEPGTKPAAPAAPAGDPGAAPAASTPADPVNSGKKERV